MADARRSSASTEAHGFIELEMLWRAMGRESPQRLFDNWRFAEGSGGNIHAA